MAANQHGWYTANERAQYVQDYLSSNLSLTKCKHKRFPSIN